MKKIKDIVKNHPLILFDGVCNLCDKSVQFIIRNDERNVFLFSTLQNKTVQLYLENQPKKIKNIDAIILITNKKTYTKSSAALTIAKHLKGLYPLLYVFYIVPKSLRDPFYDFIAKHRYKWFGKKEQCMIPDKNIQNKFL